MRNSRFGLWPAILILLLAVAGLGSFFVERPMREARAQSILYNYQTAGGATSISAATPAVLISAVTGKQIVVVGLKCATVTTGGIVTFYNGTANPLTTGPQFASGTAVDGTTVGGNGLSMYCPASTSANANVDLNQIALPLEGPGCVATTKGNALCAQLNGATLVYQIQYFLR